MGRLLALLAVTGTVGLVATPGCAAGGHSKPKTATQQTEARAVPTPAISRTRGRVVTVTPPPQPSGTRWVDVVVDGRVVGSGTAAPFTYRLDTAPLVQSNLLMETMLEFQTRGSPPLVTDVAGWSRRTSPGEAPRMPI